ncbi:hypothetical protein D3C85_813050 [compost metagenome]
MVCEDVFQWVNNQARNMARVLKQAVCGRECVSGTDTFPPKQGKALGKSPQNQGKGASNLDTASKA